MYFIFCVSSSSVLSILFRWNKHPAQKYRIKITVSAANEKHNNDIETNNIVFLSALWILHHNSRRTWYASELNWMNEVRKILNVCLLDFVDVMSNDAQRSDAFDLEYVIFVFFPLFSSENHNMISFECVTFVKYTNKHAADNRYFMDEEKDKFKPNSCTLISAY